MSKLTLFTGEFVSLAVMLLMVVALAAGQADATSHGTGADDTSTLTVLATPASPDRVNGPRNNAR